jgi:parvulin-like peptidyl-prolyl isomerase
VLQATLFSQAASSDSDWVVRDDGVAISRAEFEAALSGMPEKVRQRAAQDLGDRLELISGMLESRKLAAKAEQLTPEDEGYWDLHFKLIAAKQTFMFQRDLDAIRVPNAEALAQEWYRTQKDKYAKVPETRASSHILFASPPGLPRDELRKTANAVLDQLRAGADFGDMVAAYSEDPGSKARNGSLDQWIRLGERSITPPYSGALFDIAEVGGYSEVTDSQFGLHIIRLDGIREAGYKEYEEVRSDIFNDILAEFRRLAAAEVRSRYRITDDAFIDGAAMEALFAPYK